MPSNYSSDTAHALAINQKRLTIQVIADCLLYLRTYNIPLDSRWQDGAFKEAFDVYSTCYVDRIKLSYKMGYKMGYNTTEFFAGSMFATALGNAKHFFTHCSIQDWHFLRSFTEYMDLPPRYTDSDLELNVALVYTETAK